MIIKILKVSGSPPPSQQTWLANRFCRVVRGGARAFAEDWDPEALVDATSETSSDGGALLEKAIETQSLSARGFHRILRLA